MKRNALSAVLILIACASYLLALESQSDPATADTILIKDATILTVSHGTIPKGSILIRDGKIAEVGTNVKTPSGARII